MIYNLNRPCWFLFLGSNNENSYTIFIEYNQEFIVLEQILLNISKRSLLLWYCFLFKINSGFVDITGY